MGYYSTYKSTNKYGNNPKEYNGAVYQSTVEADKARDLDLLVRAGEIKGWERQRKVELNFVRDGDRWYLTDEPGQSLSGRGVEFRHFRRYYVDFVITRNDGTEEWLDIKTGVAKRIFKARILINILEGMAKSGRLSLY